MDIRGYHIRVAAKTAELKALYPTNSLFVITREVAETRQVAGSVHEVSVANAARFLVQGSHEIASVEQTDKYLAHNAVIRESLLAGQNAKDGARLNVRITK